MNNYRARSVGFSRPQQLLFVLCLCLMLPGSGVIATESDETKTMVLVSFAEIEEVSRWRIINDGVMGGVSRSSIERTDSGNGRFSGLISLENNGGFASCRRQLPEVNLKGYTGFLLRVKGDGQAYKFRVRMDEKLTGVAYSWDFATEPDTWIEIRLPFSQHTPTLFGQPVPNAPSLNPENVRQLGFLISDKQAGPFQLEIGHVEVYK